jgi:hypothetical protein
MIVMKVTPEYLAGILDGEGHIGIQRHQFRHGNEVVRYQHALRVMVVNTSMQLLESLQESWGGWIRQHRVANTRWLPTYGWMVTSKSADKVLAAALPFLIVKRRQAELAIEFRATVTARHHGPGRPVPLHVIERRAEIMEEIKTLNGGKTQILPKVRAADSLT